MLCVVGNKAGKQRKDMKYSHSHVIIEGNDSHHLIFFLSWDGLRNVRVSCLFSLSRESVPSKPRLFVACALICCPLWWCLPGTCAHSSHYSRVTVHPKLSGIEQYVFLCSWTLWVRTLERAHHHRWVAGGTKSPRFRTTALYLVLSEHLVPWILPYKLGVHICPHFTDEELEFSEVI